MHHSAEDADIALDKALEYVDWKKVYHNTPFKATGTDYFSGYVWSKLWHS